jgi:anti-sigma factor RsiW
MQGPLPLTLISHGEKSMEVVEKSHMSCPDVSELLGEYVDRSLPASLHGMVESHISHCPSCRALTRDYLRTIELARTLRDRPVPEGVKARLRDALSQRLGIDLPPLK